MDRFCRVFRFTFPDVRGTGACPMRRAFVIGGAVVFGGWRVVLVVWGCVVSCHVMSLTRGSFTRVVCRWFIVPRLF